MSLNYNLNKIDNFLCFVQTEIVLYNAKLCYIMSPLEYANENNKHETSPYNIRMIFTSYAHFSCNKISAMLALFPAPLTLPPLRHEMLEKREPEIRRYSATSTIVSYCYLRVFTGRYESSKLNYGTICNVMRTLYTNYEHHIDPV